MRTKSKIILRVLSVLAVVLIMVPFTANSMGIADRLNGISIFGDLRRNSIGTIANESGVTSAGIMGIYGYDPGLIQYNGEIPKAASKTDNASDYAYSLFYVINGHQRKFDYSTDKNLNVTSQGCWVKDQGNENDIPNVGLINPPAQGKNCLQFQAINTAASANWILIIIQRIFYFINGIFFLIITVLIMIKNFNFQTILNTLDGGGALSRTIGQIFLLNGDNIAPLLLFALISFIFTATILGIRYFKGTATVKAVTQELAILFIAALIVGIFVNPENINKFTSAVFNGIQQISSNISGSKNNQNYIDPFRYETQRGGSSDISQKQIDQVANITLNNTVHAMTGYNISELWITNPDNSGCDGGGTSGFSGDDEGLKKAYDGVYTDGKFDFILRLGNNTCIDNVGYWLVASQSVVGIPGSNPSSVTASSFGSGDPTRTVYAIDFMNALYNFTTNQGLKDKAKTIVTRLSAPDYMGLMFDTLLTIVLNFALCFCFLIIIMFGMLGQVIIILFPIGLGVTPILLLVKKTRPMVRKLLITYLMGIIRYFIAMSLFDLLMAIIIAIV